MIRRDYDIIELRTKYVNSRTVDLQIRINGKFYRGGGAELPSSRPCARRVCAWKGPRVAFAGEAVGCMVVGSLGLGRESAPVVVVVAWLHG